MSASRSTCKLARLQVNEILRTFRTGPGGHSGGPSSGHARHRSAIGQPGAVRLGPRSYAVWAALLWTCLTALRIIGVARWIDRLTRCPGP